jgi:hypothetical protein
MPLPARIGSVLRRIEPWCDWGAYYWERLDCRGEGQGWRVELEWLGGKLLICVGPRPPVHPGADR